MKKLFAALLMVSAAGAMAAPDMDKYAKSCQVCHANGAANAPKTGDAAAWESRMAKGMCFDCSDEDYKALIEYMAAPAK